ncbi:unnamed protein product [Timema podura]|uniref:Uncharacterized protein n=1 Tax=Timema podura TaxID=61482 RepID=A0ABN7P726_TIMPD|nr:unnamed protein product [Timema podura]
MKNILILTSPYQVHGNVVPHLATSHNGRFEGSTVEHLTFYNHTECHCKPVQDVMARDSNTEHQDMRSLQRYNRPERDSRNCRCPSLYTVRHLKDGKCLCDCFDKERSCLRAKKGKDYFSHHDRLCITKQECLPPSCDFGSYLPQASRCPRKKEKFAAWGRLIGRQHPI